MATDGIRYDAKDGIAILTLDRPPVNAFSTSMYQAFRATAERVAADEAIRVVILTAEGTRMFCGGADVKELATLDAGGRAAFFAVSNDARRAFAAIPVPVIAAINGPAVGGGISYATFCDYRLAADHAYFAMPEIDRGSVAGGGLTLASVGVPPGALRLMLYTGRRYTAQQALAMHLVDEVVPADRLAAAAHDIAVTIAAKSRHALVQMKRAIALVNHNPLWGEEGYALTQRLTVELADRPETRGGMNAFLEKREPRG